MTIRQHCIVLVWSLFICFPFVWFVILYVFVGFFLKKVYSLGMGSNGSGDALYVVLFLSLRLWFIFFCLLFFLIQSWVLFFLFKSPTMVYFFCLLFF